MGLYEAGYLEGRFSQGNTDELPPSLYVRIPALNDSANFHSGVDFDLEMHRRPMPLQISCQGYRTES